MEHRRTSVTRVLPIVLLAAAGLLAGCGGGDGEEPRLEVWEVNHHEQECFGLQPALCLMVRPTASDPWSVHYGGISGFSYLPGVLSTIEVRITEVENPPADGSSLAFALEQTLSELRVPADTMFQISVTESDSLRKIDATTYTVLDRRTLRCSAADCTALDALLADGSGMLLEFDHRNSPAGPMQLLRVDCSAPTGEFRQRCLPS